MSINVVMMMIGIFLPVSLLMYGVYNADNQSSIRRANLRTKEVVFLIFIAIISGYLGSQASFFRPFKPVSLFQVSQVSWHMALFFSALALIITLRLLKLPILDTLNILAPYVSLSYALFRLGCFFSGDSCFGGPTLLPWGVQLPIQGTSFTAYFHPTPLYESIINFILFLIFSKVLIKNPYTNLGLFIVLFGSSRFLIEQFKLYPIMIFGLTEPEVFCVGCICTGIILLYLSAEDRKKVITLASEMKPTD